jgi:PIN domain nuclease of toxin-antitoxin system
MEDPENTIYFSTASSWEISIKVRLGKLVLPVAPEIFIPDCIGVDHFTVLPIGLYHSLEVVSLPMMHNDPFDRMLIAQSRVENIPILTADARIKEYDINVVW